eukprot:CAMPEP_0118896634 /NCGR_PEP_ID=MMETSP1166-20130328/4406_1 /TAXON_ID=1104430 /ORGANISM="Chrysoreinhardia sp, Strain CCMP3193" /LENGTH=259 /DNA_ID=CAMNT_0006835693 /DNA_START=33 /DNA_END=812 /DNA_ORIENTATION=+
MVAVLVSHSSEIMVGDEWQATVPEVGDVVSEVRAKKIWCANASSDGEVLEFLRRASEAVGGEPRDISEALAALHEARYDAEKALVAMRANPAKFVDVWTSRETDDLKVAVAQHGDDVAALRRAVPTKSSRQVVARYELLCLESFEHRRRRHQQQQQQQRKRRRSERSSRRGDLDDADDLGGLQDDVDDPEKVETFARLFLRDAKKALDPKVFSAFLDFLRLFDQHLIDEPEVLRSIDDLLKDSSSKVRNAFTFFKPTTY